ncbi:MAG: cupin domain-containing protein [Thermoplasmatota archaeon]
MNKKNIGKFGFTISDNEVLGAEVEGEHNRLLKVFLSPEVGNYEDATVLISDIQPGKSTGMHTHESNEIMFVAEGQGYKVCGGKKHFINKGSIMLAPKNVDHNIVNEGNDIMRLFCVYIPPIDTSGKFEEATKNMKEKFERM